MNSLTLWSSPKIDSGLLRKLSTISKPFGTVFRVLLLGAECVGKTALAVRFVTHRFIGDYDSSCERLYQQKLTIGDENVNFVILDTVSHRSKTEANLRDQILWADAFILVYSVTDQCSFEEISRLKFLINYTKNAKLRDRSHVPEAESIRPVVFLVGNKQDIFGERMVLYEQGQRGSRETACSAFFELSVRESTDIPRKLFIDLYMEWVRTAQQRLLKPPIPGTFDLSVGGLLHSWNNRKSPSRPSSPNLPAGPSESDVSPRLKRRNSPRLLVRKLFSGLGQQCVVQPSACSESEQSKPVYLYLTEDSDSEELRSLEA